MKIRPYQAEQMQDNRAAFEEHRNSRRSPSTQDHFDFDYGGIRFEAPRQPAPYAFGMNVNVIDRSKVEAIGPGEIREQVGLSHHKIMDIMAITDEDRFDHIEEIIVKSLRLTPAKGILSGGIFPMLPTVFLTSRQQAWLGTLSPEESKAACMRLYETGSFND